MLSHYCVNGVLFRLKYIYNLYSDLRISWSDSTEIVVSYGRLVFGYTEASERRGYLLIFSFSSVILVHESVRLET